MKLRIVGNKTAETESKGFVTAYNKGVEARKKSKEMECPYDNMRHGGYHAKFWLYGWHYQDEQIRGAKS